jgi:hypothetical protein
MDGSILQLAPSHCRRSMRRALRLETAVMSDAWEGSVPLLATDVSAHGLWLESDLALGVGDELLVSFIPPYWSHSAPFQARARVARVALQRRRSDRGGSGMGVSFVDLREDQSERLSDALRGLPPPLPRRAPVTRGRVGLGDATLVLADGAWFTLRAEGPLLTAGRGPLLASPLWPKVGSPMTSILRTRRELRSLVWDVPSTY